MIHSHPIHPIHPAPNPLHLRESRPSAVDGLMMDCSETDQQSDGKPEKRPFKDRPPQLLARQRGGLIRNGVGTSGPLHPAARTANALADTSGRIGTVWIGADGSTEAAAFDEAPNGTDDRDKCDQDPPSGFAAIMPAFDAQGQSDPNQRDIQDAREHPE